MEDAKAPPAKKARIEPSSTSITLALRQAKQEGYFKSVQKVGKLFEKPAALVYDLDAWEGNLKTCTDAFGKGFLHAIAFKSNGLAHFMKTALKMGYGAECASIGEVLHAQSLGFPLESIVFDSPCKTRAEIAWSLRHGMHINIDNFEELERVAEIRGSMPTPSTSSVGVRINPLVGAGEIAALSVSTGDSKFGISASCVDEILAVFQKYEWLNCVHVHTGSGGMALETLTNGVKAAVSMALRVNKQRPGQVTVMDIGGGVPANVLSDLWGTEKVPTFPEYADSLRREVPELFTDFKTVITEFGQGLNAKSGWLASRVEMVKPTADLTGQIAVIHYGADVCVRQCYTKDHNRRMELYDGETCAPKTGTVMKQHIAGPLCFQGDMLKKDLQAPKLEIDDFVVMRDTGANCLSLFSHHCSRQVPAVIGYRPSEPGSKIVVIRQPDGFAPTAAFWGGSVPEELQKALVAEVPAI